MRRDIKEYLKQYTGEEQELLNKSEIARRFNCDPRTVERYLKIEAGTIEPRKKRDYTSKLDKYKSTIINKVDVHGASAMATFKFIEKKGYTGKYSIVAEFVKEHKNEEISKATIRFETSPGLQAQVDWKEDVQMISKHGEIFKVNIFLMVLGYSRTKYVYLTTNRSQETLFSCMIDGFKYFGGIPEEILFDNMKTVVDRSKSSFTQVELNAKFKGFSDDAGFKPITCRPYRPQTKGKAEALAKLVDRLKVYNEEFEDYADLENIVNEFRDDVNSEVSQATNEIPLELLKKEKEYLKPIHNIDLLLSYISAQKEYKVNKESMVSYNGKKYSVPTKYIGKKLNINCLDNNNINIYYNNDLIVCHPLSDKKFNYKMEHAHEILKSDAFKNIPDESITSFIVDNMLKMDMLIGE